jgi:hypothetical protein
MKPSHKLQIAREHRRGGGRNYADFTFLTNLKSNGYEVKYPLIEALQIYAPSITIIMEHCQLETDHYIIIRKLLDSEE